MRAKFLARKSTRWHPQVDKAISGSFALLREVSTSLLDVAMSIRLRPPSQVHNDQHQIFSSAVLQPCSASGVLYQQETKKKQRLAALDDTSGSDDSKLWFGEPA